MLKKVLSSALIIFVVNLAFAVSVSAAANTDKEARFAEKVRTEILKLGTGTKARIEVKLKDHSKVKGYISEATDENFVVVDEKNGASTAIPYPQVKQANGNNLSSGVKIAITIAIVAGLIALLGIVLAKGSR